MKSLKKMTAVSLLALASLTISCENNPIDTLIGGKNAENEWIYETMKDAYFWSDQMPAKGEVDKDLPPDQYFGRMLYEPEKVDRFSLFTDDIDELESQFNGVIKALGISCVVAEVNAGQEPIILAVSHVVTDSPAEKAGLKRGDIIQKINGQQLTKNNYLELMAGSETIHVTLAAFEGKKLQPVKDVTVTKITLEINPVAFSKVMSIGGKKIGYLVYTQFVSGTKQEAARYDHQLREVFGQFKEANVDELVLDLRHNGGGNETSAVILGSLIVPGNTEAKLFFTEKWNAKYMEYWSKQTGINKLNRYFRREPNNIGDRLSRVFVLTSTATASASELVIKGLEPYMQVITIGDHTAGKNLFGSIFKDSKKRWKSGMYLMLGQIANAKGESDYGTVNGIAPTVKVDDTEMPFLPFGDENETLLNAALTYMGLSTRSNDRTQAVTKVTGLGVPPVKDTPTALDGRLLREMP